MNQAKKPLIPWYAFVAGAITTLLLSGGMGLLAGTAGEEVTLATWLPGVVIGLIVIFIVSSLSANRKVATASDAERDAALSFTPPPGKALVLAYRQGFIGKAVGLNLAMDGRAFAQIKSPRFTSIAVDPGSHTLAGAFSGMAATQNRGAEIAFVAQAGETYCFRCTIAMGLAKNSVTTEAVDRPIAQAQMRGMRMTLPDLREL